MSEWVDGQRWGGMEGEGRESMGGEVDGWSGEEGREGGCRMEGWMKG